jgi:hypothetical protein
MAAQSSGIGQVGSFSWAAEVGAGVLSVLGPLVFCTGVVLKYRAESLGLRSTHVKVPLATLVRRFFVSGIALIIFASFGVVSLLVTFHHTGEISPSLGVALASLIRSAYVVGIVLAAAPLITPFLVSSPKFPLPMAEEDFPVPAMVIRGEIQTNYDVEEACLMCSKQGALRQA